MNIRFLESKKDEELWNAYVMRSNKSCCYHFTGWKDVIEKSFGHKSFFILSENKEKEINGILPLVQLKSLLFGNFIISLPYFNYGGLCFDDNKVAEELLNKGVEVAKRENADYVEFRYADDMSNITDLPVKTAKVSMRLALPQKHEEILCSLPSKIRSQIKRPSKEGMYARFGREEELENFYKIFSINMRDLGTPVYPKRFFMNILTRFPEDTWICTVYSKDKYPVASGFLVGFKNILEIPWASSLREYNRFSPNMLLYSSVLEFACGKGYTSFDFGRSTPGEGTYKFKEQWGATPVQLYWYYWMKNGEAVSELNNKNPKYKLAINIWQRLPVGLTKIIGPMIVKNLP